MPEALMQKIIVPFEQKIATKTGEFEGHGAVFDNIDMGMDVIVKGAFQESLLEWKGRGQLPMLPWFHDISNPIGEFMEMNEDHKGLFTKGMLWVPGNALDRDPIEQSKQVRNLLLSNGPKGMSIGFSVAKESFGEQEGRRVRFLEKINLWEVSIVPFGMNPEALITSAKGRLAAGALPTERETERLLRDAGFSKKHSQALIADGYKGLKPEGQRDADTEVVEEKVDFELLEMLAKLNSVLKGD